MRKLTKIQHVSKRINNILSYLDTEKRTKTRLIVTHIFPNSYLSNLEMLDDFDIIDKINGSKCNNIEQFRKLAKILVITRGDKGSSIYSGENSFEFPSKRVKSLSTIGAGDIFATVFSHTFFHSKNISFAAQLANEIAAKSTMYRGLKSINSDVFRIAMKRK